MAFIEIAGANRASTATAPRGRGLLARIGAIFNDITVARSRVHEVERLNAKSDVELARIGLKREDIARHVFRDVLYI
ncbi:DUF1127 domain-containing protein [Rhodobacteraceae bacterium W635]|uniref:DUF1127 domain-containing protein n=1 Tax=Nioella halotolerans TaxID=2303578 RepID=UPI000E3DA2F8|nr:DUF1127 domain-containing protein [Rhodobacteraceae bacterium W635]